MLFGYLASVFLELPDEAFVRSLRQLSLPSTDEPEADAQIELRDYLLHLEGQSDEQASAELGRDRARLVRYVNVNCVRPPYESLYVQALENEVVGSLNRIFQDAGFAPRGDLHEAPDQIGMELAFMQASTDKALQALEAQDEKFAEALLAKRDDFFSDHLARWAADYGREMSKAAETSFYRSIGLMLQDLA